LKVDGHHGWTRAHFKYNKEYEAVTAEYFKKNNIKDIGGLTAKSQLKHAKRLNAEIGKNSYLRAYNKETVKGTDKLNKWFNGKGGDIKLKATGKAAKKGGRVMTGIGKASGLARKVPGLGPVMMVGGVITGVAKGEDASTVSIDTVMGMTGGDIAQSTIGGVAEVMGNAMNANMRRYYESEMKNASSEEEASNVYKEMESGGL